MTYAAIIATLVILNSYILHLKGINEFTNRNPNFWQNLRVIILGTGIFISIMNLMNKVLHKRISFGQYLLYGTLIGLFYGIIDAFYFVIFAKYIDPTTISTMIEISKEQYAQLGFPSDMANMVVGVLNKPIVLFFSDWFSDILISFFYTLFFAIFYIILPKPKNLD